MIDVKLMNDLTDAVEDIIDASYTLQCLNDAAHDEIGYFANITASITQLMVKVINNAIETINNVIDSIDNKPEEGEPCKE